MVPKLLFIGSGVLVLALLFVYAGYKSKLGTLGYIRTEKGKGALSSALLFVVVLSAFVLLFGCSSARAAEGEWFQYYKIHMGLDRTKKLSPQCENTGPDTHLTSNGGLELGVWRYGAFNTAVTYLHHSCAISPDDRQYDAFGFKVEYTGKFPWSR